MELAAFVEAVACSFAAADALGPVATSQRSGKAYSPGIGPHAEDAAIALTLLQLRKLTGFRDLPIGQFLRYPNGRQTCDLWIGEPPEWAIEAKMARFKGDNGRPDDMAIKDLLSPYEADRSALTDTVKLATSNLPCRKAVLIYGFDYPERPLEPAIAAFETLAQQRVSLGPRCQTPMGPLVHPHHSHGTVYAWEVQ